MTKIKSKEFRKLQYSLYALRFPVDRELDCGNFNSVLAKISQAILPFAIDYDHDSE